MTRSFAFGTNWQRFLDRVDEPQIEAAMQSLRDMLEIQDLKGKRFLDVGSGSGLFSLAATRLGADVFSFDSDKESVACTEEVKRRFASVAAKWDIEKGSILDEDYLKKLGQFDVVYAWGVMHHTEDMPRALAHAATAVGEDGKIFISIYNDQGKASRIWKCIKSFYNAAPNPLKWLLVLIVGAYFELKSFLAWLTAPRRYLVMRKKRGRGMAKWYDLVDWVGGYPFEVAKPEEIFDFYRERGFVLRRLKTHAGGIGCNEFVFERRI